MSPGRSLWRLWGRIATLPLRSRRPEIGRPERVGHSDWTRYLPAEFNRPGMRVLEIGARNVTGANLRSRFDKACYIGFDVYPGDNVDVVGDAHRLSACFEGQAPFDLIFASAVFEHLAMPWVVADEIRKLLKIGGCVFIETHFSYSSHERPWHFYQFSDMGLRALFNPAMGFEVLDSGMDNPILGFFAPTAARKLRHLPVTELYCHSGILCRKAREVEGFSWTGVGLDEVVGETRYPPPGQTSG